MRSKLSFEAVIVLLLLLDSGISAGGGTPQRIWGEAAQQIQRAAALPDGVEREDALRIALRAGLTQPDKAACDEVFEYLTSNQRWLDLRPYAEIVRQVDPTHSRKANWLLDEAELIHGLRSDRLRWFDLAITGGEVKLPHGRPLTRELAMSFAAIQGLSELEPLIQQYAAQVDERWRKSFQFESFPSMFELGNGAENREDALRLASERLAQMEDSDVRARMDRDAGFRMAIFQVAEDVCALNPFSGRLNKGCSKMKEVVRRQIVLDRNTVGQASKTLKAETFEVDWLEGLKQRVPEH